MNIPIAFALGEKVSINELACKGTVVGIYASLDSVSYKVRYFHEFSAKEIFLYENEISKSQERQKVIGFKVV